MKKVFLLVDYRGQFYFSTRYRGAFIDIDKLKIYFAQIGIDLIIKSFYEINLRKENFKDEWILYQSSEDPNLLYKDYIEDVLLALELQGAKLIPKFQYFRAHHNKVFMEFLRDVTDIDEIKNIKSKCFGTLEEYIRSDVYRSADISIIKPGMGTRGRGIKILDIKNKKRIVKKASGSFTLHNFKLWISKIRTGKTFTPMSNNRKKFIIQNFINNLEGDHRILAYGDKFYYLYRKNRDNDFRASGSGNLDFEKTPPDGLLDYAQTVYKKFKTPFMSLDIGYKNGQFYLFEFQFLCLGQYTLEKSTFYYKKEANVWKRKYEVPNLEREFCKTVSDFICSNIH